MRTFALVAVATALPLMACSQMDSWFHPQSQARTQAQQQPTQQASQQYGSQQYGNQQSGTQQYGSQQYGSQQPGNQQSGQQYGRTDEQRNSSGLNQDQIKQVQQALDSKGFNPGPADGRMGPETKSALNQFQQKQGLQQTGAPDQQTLAALGVGQNNNENNGAQK